MEKIICTIACFFWILFLSQESEAGLLGMSLKAGKVATKSAKVSKVLEFIERTPLKKGASFNKEFKLIKPLVRRSWLYDDIALKYGEKTASLFFRVNKGIAEELIREFGDDIVAKGITRNDSIKLLGFERVYKVHSVSEVRKRLKETITSGFIKEFSFHGFLPLRN